MTTTVQRSSGLCGSSRESKKANTNRERPAIKKYKEKQRRNTPRWRKVEITMCRSCGDRHASMAGGRVCLCAENEICSPC